MYKKQSFLKNAVPFRQALVLGALLNLTGATLALFVDVRFVALSVLISGGLLVSGLFGWCPMAYFLSLLPINKKYTSQE